MKRCVLGCSGGDGDSGQRDAGCRGRRLQRDMGGYGEAPKWKEESKPVEVVTNVDGGDGTGGEGCGWHRVTEEVLDKVREWRRRWKPQARGRSVGRVED